jgi:hypothetical protein
MSITYMRFVKFSEQTTIISLSRQVFEMGNY